MKRSIPPHQRGYSLVEMLVVVAIVGILSLVTVPNFMSMYRSMKIKTSVRNAANDLRSARQEAVTRNQPVMVSFGVTSAERNFYWIYRWNDTASEWQPFTNFSRRSLPGGRVELEPATSPDKKTVYISAAGYADTTGPGSGGAADGRPDVIFEAAGGIRTNPSSPTITVRTDQTVAKNQWVLRIYPSGSVKVE